MSSGMLIAGQSSACSRENRWQGTMVAGPGFWPDFMKGKWDNVVAFIEIH
jgi:hypothetical protein